MVDRIRTFSLQSDRLSGFERANNLIVVSETIGQASAPSQRPPLLSAQAASHAAGERRAISIFKSPPECSAPFAAFLFALGIAFGAYVLLPLFLPHKLALFPEDRLTAAAGDPLL